MEEINKWLFDNLGDWTLEFYGLFLLIAAGLALILLITWIICAVRHGKNKRKIKSLTAAKNAAAARPSDDELRENIRKEFATDIERETAAANEAREAANTLSDTNDRLRNEIKELEAQNKKLTESDAAKQDRIDELASALEIANANTKKSETNDLYRKLNELNQTNKELSNEINLLKAENATIKAQELQRQVAESKRKPAAETTAAADAPAKAPKATKAKKAPAPEPPEEDEDDEYDEYFDDFGDETSLIKVTVKFDRLKNNWVVNRSDSDKTCRRLATKQEAVGVAKDLARRLHAQLVIHKKDGKFQKV